VLLHGYAEDCTDDQKQQFVLYAAFLVVGNSGIFPLPPRSSHVPVTCGAAMLKLSFLLVLHRVGQNMLNRKCASVAEPCRFILAFLLLAQSTNRFHAPMIRSCCTTSGSYSLVAILMAWKCHHHAFRMHRVCCLRLFEQNE
jgi:hypothetical protein